MYRSWRRAFLGPEWLAALLVVISFTFLITACSHERKAEGVSSPWVEFELDAFSGLVRRDWSIQEMDADNLLDQGMSSTLPPEVRNSAENFKRSGLQLGRIPVILLPQNQNITAVTCLPGSLTTSQARSALSAQGIQSEVAGKVQIDGIDRDILRLTLTTAVVTYQVYTTTGTCTSVFTLTVLPGNEALAEDFKYFLAHLSFGARR